MYIARPFGVHYDYCVSLSVRQFALSEKLILITLA